MLQAAGVGLGAQQNAGRVFNPRSNPTNADLVAYERLDNDRRELQFLVLSSGAVSSLRKAPPAAPAGMIGLPDIAGSNRLSAFSGDLDWRPGSQGGPYWFAYVASDDRGLGLYLNAVDRNGMLAMPEPLRVPFTGNAREPRWSPDGRHLAFVSDSGVLHIVPDADQAARAGATTRLRAVRVGQASIPALFPEWSPLGDHIAYQVEKNVRGDKKFAIEVVPVDKGSGTVAGAAASVTDALTSENAYRPSWSPGDGKYLAFYVDRGGQRGDAQVMDIGVLEVQKAQRTGHVLRGELREGRSRRIAEGVVPSQSRGPVWTTIGDAAQKSQLAIAYVQKDEARNNPVMVVGVQRWLDMRQRNEFEVQLSQGWGTSNHKDVFEVDMPQVTRYVYASVERGGESVKYKDVPAPWVAMMPAPATTVAVQPQAVVSQPATVRPASRGSAFPALLLPGGAQLARGEVVKGGALAAVTIGGVAVALLAHQQVNYHNGLKDGPNSSPANTAYEQDKVASKTTLAYGGIAVASAAMLYSLWDATRGGSSSGDLGIRLTPLVQPQYSSVGGQLAFRIPFGSSRR